MWNSTVDTVGYTAHNNWKFYLKPLGVTTTSDHTGSTLSTMEEVS